MKCNGTPKAQAIRINGGSEKDTYVSKHIHLIVLFLCA